MSKFNIEVLDKRHALHTVYSHRAKIHCSDDTVPLFCEARAWCWEVFGPGIDRELVPYMHIAGTAANYRWAWHCEERYLYLYLKDESASAFMLKYQ